MKWGQNEVWMKREWGQKWVKWGQNHLSDPRVEKLKIKFKLKWKWSVKWDVKWGEMEWKLKCE